MRFLPAVLKLFLFSVALSIVFGNIAAIALILVMLSLPAIFIRGGKRISGILAIDLGTIASGVGTPTTIPIQYCPQILYWIQTAAVDVNIKVLGDGTTYDVPATGITELGVLRQLGRFTNAYVLSITNGLLVNKTTSITITNQVASAFTLYGWSENEGNSYIRGISQLMVAASGIDFTDFKYLTFPGAGATDQYTLTFKNGVNQAMRREELRARLQRFQNPINSTGYSIDNLTDEIRKVNVIPAAQQTAYVNQLVTAKGTAADRALLSRAG
jgi:hypothetical protein